MSASLRRLWPLFHQESAAGRPLVLATVVNTVGSTYTKAGAQMVIAKSGEYAGLLSGGCLEGDLAERARTVFELEVPQIASYDMRGADDVLFGLGSGCEGAMEILLQYLSPSLNWQPMKQLEAAYLAQRAEALLLVVKSPQGGLTPGSNLFVDNSSNVVESKRSLAGIRQNQAWRALADYGKQITPHGSSRLIQNALPGTDLLLLIQAPAPNILLLGAGPDAQPVCELANTLGWRVTVVDHRGNYAQSSRFPGAAQVLDSGPEALSNLFQDHEHRATPYSAAIVMSHHLRMDQEYLAGLASSDIPYVGLLGPIGRRERLLSQLGPRAETLRSRLRSPVGLDLGATTPEAIALSIIAEIHAAIAGRDRPVALGSH
jgi:xanthine dehydrogenase accessory factor